MCEHEVVTAEHMNVCEVQVPWWNRSAICCSRGEWVGQELTGARYMPVELASHALMMANVNMP
jgi:CYTH domain-containing protein